MDVSTLTIVEATTSPAKFDGPNNTNNNNNHSQIQFSIVHAPCRGSNGRINSMDEGISVSVSPMSPLGTNSKGPFSSPIQTISASDNNKSIIASGTTTKGMNYLPFSSPHASSSPVSSSKSMTNSSYSPSSCTIKSPPTTTTSTQLKTIQAHHSESNDKAKIKLLKNMLNQTLELYKISQQELTEERREKEKLQEQVRVYQEKERSQLRSSEVSLLPPRRRRLRDSSPCQSRSRSSSCSSTCSTVNQYSGCGSRRSASPPQLSPVPSASNAVTSNRPALPGIPTNTNKNKLNHHSLVSHSYIQQNRNKRSRLDSPSVYPSRQPYEYDNNEDIDDESGNNDDDLDVDNEEDSDSNENYNFPSNSNSNYYPGSSNSGHRSHSQHSHYDREESQFNVKSPHHHLNSKSSHHHHQNYHHHRPQYSNYKTSFRNSTDTRTTCTQVVKTLSRPKPNIKITDMVTERRIVHVNKMTKSNGKMTNSILSSAEKQYGHRQTYSAIRAISDRMRAKSSSQLKEKNHSIYQQHLRGNNKSGQQQHLASYNIRGGLKTNRPIINSESIVPRMVHIPRGRGRPPRSQVNSNSVNEINFMVQQEAADYTDDQDQNEGEEDEDEEMRMMKDYSSGGGSNRRNFQMAEDDDVLTLPSRKRHSPVNLSHQMPSSLLRSENSSNSRWGATSANSRDGRVNSAEASTSSSGATKRISQQVRHSLPYVNSSGSSVRASEDLITHKPKVLPFQPRQYEKKIDYNLYTNEKDLKSISFEEDEETSSSSSTAGKRKEESSNSSSISSAIVPVKDNSLALKVSTVPRPVGRPPLNREQPIPDIFAILTSEGESCMTAQVPYHFYESEANAEKVRQQLLDMEKDNANDQDDFKNKIQLSNCKAEEKVVEIPRWRQRIIEAKRQADLDESLDDQVFLKRHSKCEINERRRKRWDSQRLREESYLEKLKRKREERELQKMKKRRRRARGDAQQNYKEDDDENTFQPTIQDARSIRVGDDIPLSIFGYVMPIIEEAEFELPWTMDVKPSLKPPRKSEPAVSKFPYRQNQAASQGGGHRSQATSMTTDASASTPSSSTTPANRKGGSVGGSSCREVRRRVV